MKGQYNARNSREKRETRSTESFPGTERNLENDESELRLR